MNKKEVLEIRKQFTQENHTISRICGCYVDGEKEVKFTSKDAFHSLPEEDAFKYFEIFRKTLSGTIGKNLLNMEFPLEQEAEGGTQEFLLKLRDSKLLDDALLDEFYKKIIENYVCNDNFFIILIHAAYDVPGKSTAGDEMFDASDEVYEYILCSICPVKLSKAGLGYNQSKNCIEDRTRDWVVDTPAKGFLFPQFNDRTTDIHGVLYYSKNSEELQYEFVEQVLGSTLPMSAGDQKETFHTFIEEAVGEDCDYEIVKNIHENLNEMLEQSKDEPEPLVLTKNDVRNIFEKSGVPNEKMEQFEDEFNSEVGEKAELVAQNIAETRKFNIETPDVVIKVNPDRTDLVETKMIDGRECIVITVSDRIQVNGVTVKATKEERTKEERTKEE